MNGNMFTICVLALLIYSCKSGPNSGNSNFKDIDAEFQNAPIKSPRERFDVLVNQIDGYLQGVYGAGSPESCMDAMRSSGIVTPLRYFQELMTIYAEKYEMKEYDEEAHTLENHISHYGDLESFYSTARASGRADAIATAKKNLDDAKAAFLTYCSTSSWFKKNDGLVAKLRSKMDGISWSNIEQDRNFVLNKIAKKLKKQHEKEYDFTKVEEGIHELRRDARRITYLNSAAMNVIKFDKSGACPLFSAQQYDRLTEEQRKNIVPMVIPKPEPRPTSDYYCHVSSCTLDSLSSVSSQLVTLKTEGASYLARGEAVPARIFQSAKELHQSLYKSLNYMWIWADLKNCMTRTTNEGDAAEQNKRE